VLEVKAAKEVRGRVELPPNPDFLLVGGLLAVAANKSMRIGPVAGTPLCRDVRETLSALVDIEERGGSWSITPKPQATASSLAVPGEQMRYRQLTVFLLMALGKTVVLRSVTEKRLDSWKRMAKQAGCAIETKSFDDGSAGLSLVSADTFAMPAQMEPDALHAYLGLAIGLKRGILFQVDYQISSPLRNLLPAVGYDVTIRSESSENEALARRMRFLRGRKKSDVGVTYSFTGDFTKCSGAEAAISVPGDDILGGVLLVAKALVPRGNLIIENVPLEPWANALPNLVRKMGCRPAVQETGETSLGKTGMIQPQKFELAGRKTECTPLYQYEAHVPAMVVLSCFAQGQSILRNLRELRENQPDGIEEILACVRAMGGRHGEMPDGIVMDGAKQLDGFDLPDETPAPIAGAFAVAGLKCMGTTKIADQALARRWPSFAQMLDEICEYRK